MQQMWRIKVKEIEIREGISMRFMMYHVLTMAVGILLFAAAITDIRKKQVGRPFLILLAMVCTVTAVMQEKSSFMDAAGGVTVGLCVVGISMISREQIGRGDGIVIAAVGIVLGFRRCLAAVSAASLLMCVAAVVVLLFKKGNRHTRLAFLPALFVGYVLCGVGG